MYYMYVLGVFVVVVGLVCLLLFFMTMNYLLVL